MATFPGPQQPASPQFPGAQSNSPFFQGSPAQADLFPGAHPNPDPFQASFPPRTQGTFPGAAASQGPFPGAVFPGASSTQVPIGPSPSATQFPGALQPAPTQPLAPEDNVTETTPLVRNPAPIGPPPLVQMYPPVIKPALDLYIEEMNYIVRLTQRPLEVGGIIGTALLPLNKPAILRGEAALMAGTPIQSSPDVDFT